MSYQFTLEPNLLEQELKKLIIQETEKDGFSFEEITDDEPLVYRETEWCVNI